WPDGADLFVGVRIVKNGQQMYPTGDDDYAAFNDFTHEFGVSFPIESGDEIVAEFENNKDSDVPINVSLESEKKFSFETMEEIRERLQ
ncbi:MAG: hypothetical protein ABEJ72_00160, partial [Candidatus Aenigmatarchaeota archaeon]